METQIHNPAGERLAVVDHAEGPNVVTVQRVGWRRLEDSAKHRSVERFGIIRDLGGAAFVQEMMGLHAAAKRQKLLGSGTVIDVGAPPAEVPEEPEPPEDPVTSYDIGILLAGGVKHIDGKTPLVAHVDEWTPELAQEAARCILKLSRPMLFDTEADRKNV